MEGVPSTNSVLALVHALVQFIEVILLNGVALLDVLLVNQPAGTTGQQGKNSAK